LPYLFTGTESNLKKALAGEAVQMAMSRNWMQDLEQWREGDSAALLNDVGTLGLGLWDVFKKYRASKGANAAGFRAEETENANLAVGEVVAITGCASDQTSADVGNVSAQFGLQPSARGNAGGALTSAFIETIETQCIGSYSYVELLESIRQRLSSLGFSQVPQLASSLLIDLQQPFSVDSVTLPADLVGTSPGGSKCRDSIFPAAGIGAAGGMGAAGGFMAALAAAPLGLQMLQGQGGDDEPLQTGGNFLPTLLSSAGVPEDLAEKVESDLAEEIPVVGELFGMLR